MIILTTASGLVYEKLAEKSKRVSESLGYRHDLIISEGGKALKVNFWKHLPATNDFVLLLDADAHLTSEFKEPKMSNDIMGVDVIGLTGKRIRWSGRHKDAGASEPMNEFKINSGVIFFKTSTIARRVGERWADFYRGNLDEPALWRALIGEDVGHLPSSYNHPSPGGEIQHHYNVNKQ